MALFTWYKKYSVNNEELDNDHKKLIAILNRLFDTCIQAHSINCVEPVIEELIKYTDYHFISEEKYMVEKGYKDIDEHRRAHKFFVDKLYELRDYENKEDYDYKKDVIVFLGNWIIKHVTVEDKKYSLNP